MIFSWLVLVDFVAVPLWIGQRLQQQVEKHSPRHEQSYQQHSLPWLGVDHFHEVRKSHEIAISVNNKRSREVSSFDEEERGVHPEDGGVGELEHRHQEGGENILA